MTISTRVQRELLQGAPASKPTLKRRRRAKVVGTQLTAAKNKGKAWTAPEHQRFLQALELYPTGPWKSIAAYVGTKNPRQTMTHAQKFRQKMERQKRGLRNRRRKRGKQRVSAKPKPKPQARKRRVPRPRVLVFSDSDAEESDDAQEEQSEEEMESDADADAENEHEAGTEIEDEIEAEDAEDEEDEEDEENQDSNSQAESDAENERDSEAEESEEETELADTNEAEMEDAQESAEHMDTQVHAFSWPMPDAAAISPFQSQPAAPDSSIPSDGLAPPMIPDSLLFPLLDLWSSSATAMADALADVNGFYCGLSQECC